MFCKIRKMLIMEYNGVVIIVMVGKECVVIVVDCCLGI